MNATKTAPVSCLCCRKSTATHMIKDIGFRTYPVCNTCKKSCMVRESTPINNYRHSPAILP